MIKQGWSNGQVVDLNFFKSLLVKKYGFWFVEFSQLQLSPFIHKKLSNRILAKYFRHSSIRGLGKLTKYKSVTSSIYLLSEYSIWYNITVSLKRQALERYTQCVDNISFNQEAYFKVFFNIQPTRKTTNFPKHWDKYNKWNHKNIFF